MLYRPSDLPAESKADFDAYAGAVRDRALDQIATMLQEIEPSLAQQVYELAFEQNEALPKRTERPQLRSAVLAAAAADAFDLDDPTSDALLAFTVAIQEYFDLLDDVVDDDVRSGDERSVLLVSQVLLPLALRRLAVLGTDAVSYWSECVPELVSAPVAETQQPPSQEAYDRIVDRQSVLYGFVPALAAIAGCQSDADVEHAEAVGRTIYRHSQFVRDYEEYADGRDDDPWNAAALYGADAVCERLERWRADVETATEEYQEPASRRLAALVTLNVRDWRDAVDGD